MNTNFDTSFIPYPVLNRSQLAMSSNSEMGTWGSDTSQNESTSLSNGAVSANSLYLANPPYHGSLSMRPATAPITFADSVSYWYPWGGNVSGGVPWPQSGGGGRFGGAAVPPSTQAGPSSSSTSPSPFVTYPNRQAGLFATPPSPFTTHGNTRSCFSVPPPDKDLMANRSSMGGTPIPVHSATGSKIFGLDRAVIHKDLLAILDKMVTLEDNLTEINRMISELHVGDEVPPTETPAGEGLNDPRIKREADVQLQAFIENTNRRKFNTAALTKSVFAPLRPLVNAHTGLEIPEFPLELHDLRTLSLSDAKRILTALAIPFGPGDDLAVLREKVREAAFYP